MKNSVRASMDFYFKGKQFSPSVVIDIDDYFKGHHNLEFIYRALAASLGMDEYRHEYDVMMLEDIVYSEPQGLVAGFVHDGQMDWQGLEKAWHDAMDIKVLTPIANKFFNVENLDDDPKLAAALLAAYRAGRDKAVALAKANTGWNEVF